MASKKKWQATRESWRFRIGRSIYHHDGTLRRQVIIIGIILITIPVLLFALLTVKRLISRGRIPTGQQQKAQSVEKTAVTKAASDSEGAGEKKHGFGSTDNEQMNGSSGVLPELTASFRSAARALTRERDPASAAAWRRLHQWDSDDFNQLDQCWYAVALCQSGSLAKGTALVNFLLARFPANVDVQATAGYCAGLRGEREVAEKYYARALELGSDKGRVIEGSLQNFLLAQGVAEKDEATVADGTGGQVDEKVAESRETIEQEVSVLRADAMRMTAEGDKSAREAWKRLFISFPEEVCDEDRGWYAVVLCEDGLLARGKELIDLLLGDSAESADLQVAAGRCAFLRGERELGRWHLERALELQPEHGTGKRWLGEFAGEFARRSVDLGHDAAEGGVVLPGSGGNEVGQLRADALALISRDDPSSIIVWERFLSTHLAEFNDIDRCYYAVSLCENGMLFEGGELINLLVARLGESPDLHATAGRCAFLRGRKQEAWWHLSRALEMDPEHTHAGRWFKRIADSNVLAPVLLASPNSDGRKRG